VPVALGAPGELTPQAIETTANAPARAHRAITAVLIDAVPFENRLTIGAAHPERRAGGYPLLPHGALMLT
jgi:hypothetical protein